MRREFVEVRSVFARGGGLLKAGDAAKGVAEGQLRHLLNLRCRFHDVRQLLSEARRLRLVARFDHHA